MVAHCQGRRSDRNLYSGVLAQVLSYHCANQFWLGIDAKSCRTRCYIRVSVSRGSTLVSFLSASGGLQVRKLWHSARDAKQKKYFCYKNRTPFWAGSDLGSHLPAVGCSEHELSQRRAGAAERRATSPVILFCFSTSCAKACRASLIIACNCSSSKTSCSAVACSSTNLLAPVMTKFMSTSARESSS